LVLLLWVVVGVIWGQMRVFSPVEAEGLLGGFVGGCLLTVLLRLNIQTGGTTRVVLIVRVFACMEGL
jgi:membrane associated rhomboid family serine protease